MKTVLLTGFEPFGGNAVNPSQLVASRLNGAELGGCCVIGATLACEFGRSISQLKGLMERHQPVLVVCLGLAENRADITPERIAINVDDAPIADNFSLKLIFVSSQAIPISSLIIISPSSIPAFIFITVTPVDRSPPIIARFVGAAPRHFGRSDPCKLIANILGMDRILTLSIWPNDITTNRSALKLIRYSADPGLEASTG